ncbi:hypothetical protein RESH_00641 [Rhodopirellula europaea SH398]|uniref:Uncharacterized protein n=1 Tax=Rhodopirellula europaea SH398 TaxID=1263868 RepID=M5SLV0_9BACT|nr:hypothetical protein RESH_00641 [Rhodopirellula europaea SH398]
MLRLESRWKCSLPFEASSRAVGFTGVAPCRAIVFCPDRGGVVRIPATQRDFLCL